MIRMSKVSRLPGPSFTPRQGQYLACAGSAPCRSRTPAALQSEPPSVHQMVLTLERAGLIRRQPGVARSIEVLIAPENLPVLR